MKYRISCIVEVPDEVTEEEVYQWARYELGENGVLSLKNPLSDRDLEATCSSVDVRKEGE